MVPDFRHITEANLFTNLCTEGDLLLKLAGRAFVLERMLETQTRILCGFSLGILSFASALVSTQF
jgi:hypothetical protein